MWLGTVRASPADLSFIDGDDAGSTPGCDERARPPTPVIAVREGLPERATDTPESWVRRGCAGVRELVRRLRRGAGLQLGSGRVIGGRGDRVGRVALARALRRRVAVRD